MTAKNLSYFFKEGIKGFLVNGLMSVASVFIVVASLLILGIYLIFSFNVNYVSEQLKSQYEIRAFIGFDVPVENIETIKVKTQGIANVNSATIYTPEQALAEYREQLGENARILDGLEGDNPLRYSIKVTMTDIKAADSIAVQLQNIDGVEYVRNNKSSMENLISITNTIKQASLILMFLLSIVAIFIISNAIRMTVFARRREIGIAKFLGATDWFIRWPFIVEGIIMGVVGALFALILIIPGYNVVYGSLSAWAIGSNISFYNTGYIAKELLIWFIGIGALLGAFGSGISLGRYLKV